MFSKFGKKKPLLPKVFDKLPPEARRDAEQLFGKQLTEKALSLRQLGDYGESLKLSKMAAQQYAYLPAFSIHGITLRQSGKTDEAYAWYKDAYDRLSSKKPLHPVFFEVLGNIIQIERVEHKNYNQAQDAVNLARVLAANLPDSEGLSVSMSVIDIEESVLCFLRKDYKKAKLLAERRVAVIPGCPVAKEIISLLAEEKHGGIYGSLLASTNAMPVNVQMKNEEFRLSRGLEEYVVNGYLLIMTFLGARSDGWDAPGLFKTTDEGDVLFPVIKYKIRISNEDAANLFKSVSKLSDVPELSGLIEFVSDGGFVLEEVEK